MVGPALKDRKAPRARVFRGGVISFHRLGATIECTVRNLSDTGACLMVTSPVGIPNDLVNAGAKMHQPAGVRMHHGPAFAHHR